MSSPRKIKLQAVSLKTVPVLLPSAHRLASAPPAEPAQTPQPQPAASAGSQLNIETAVSADTSAGTLTQPDNSTSHSPAVSAGETPPPPTPAASPAGEQQPPPAASAGEQPQQPAAPAGPLPPSQPAESADPLPVPVRQLQVAKESVQEEVVVYATAVINDSSSETVTKTDICSLENLIFRENHLKDNIARTQIGGYDSRSFRNGRFKHTIEFLIFVKAWKLWDSPKQYIWKHLGQLEWKKDSGTRVNFTRIHVK